MTLYELADLTQTEVTLRRGCCNPERRWIANLGSYAECKDNNLSVMIGVCVGWGATPQRAMENLVANIKGKILVTNALGGKPRMEFGIPATLQHEERAS